MYIHKFTYTNSSAIFLEGEQVSHELTAPIELKFTNSGNFSKTVRRQDQILDFCGPTFK